MVFERATYYHITDKAGVPEDDEAAFSHAFTAHHKDIDLMAMIVRMYSHTKFSSGRPLEDFLTAGLPNEPCLLYARQKMADAGIQVGSLESIEKRSDLATKHAEMARQARR